MGKSALAKQIAKKLQLKDGDIILLKSGSVAAQKGNMDLLSGILGYTDRPNCVLIVVDEFDDLSILDEAQMNELGWYREAAMVSEDFEQHVDAMKNVKLKQ